MNRIPNDDDFARAEKLASERARNLDQVSISVMNKFKELCPLHKFSILPQRDVNFRAYVFFESEKDRVLCSESGINQQIIEFVYLELERLGRGNRSEIIVAFEFDSDEKVKKEFEGDYFLRLR